MTPSLIKITEIFLIPCSFLVAALGTADTNPHRAAVSLLGLIISVLWLVCSREALSDLDATSTGRRRARRTGILASLPIVFAAGWITSLIIHIALWSQVPA